MALLGSVDAHAQPFGLTTRDTVSGLNFPLAAPTITSTLNLELARAFPSLTFSQPVYLISARDGTNRLFVVERAGRIRVFQNSDSTTSTGTFLDISALVSTEGEQGFLSIAFDPHYVSNGYLYAYYNPNTGSRRSRISRFKVSSTNSNLADAASETVIIEIPQPASTSNHKGGMIAFGADNMLYIGMGDGGGGGDTNNYAQDCSNMLGSMLRIDPNGGTPYAIPSDNPFAGSASYNCGFISNASSRNCGISGYAGGQICKEIWAYGLRNPWRWSFDRVTNALWLADVGQGAWEEIDIVNSGNNMGWRLFEGAHDYNNPAPKKLLSSTTAPIYEYGRSVGQAISGGFVYRGTALPELYGKYIYGDSSAGSIWVLDYNGATVESNTLLGAISGPGGFGEDEAGEVYAASLYGGQIYRVRRKTGTSPGGVIPAKLSETGIFSSLGTLTPNPGIIEYDVNAPLWSDGAIKRRWIALPGTSKISFNATGAYTFPTGTALIKHFSLQVSPTAQRRLETRVFFQHNEGWAGYTYKWNEAGTDAFLLSASISEDIDVTDSNGTHSQTWDYPSRSDCKSCHTSQAGTVLGVRTRQLNRDFNYSGTIDNQLRSWNHIGLFSTDIGAQTAYDAYPTGYGNSAGTLEKRTRAYLDANCAHCHQPGVPRSGEFDLRFDTSIGSMNILNVVPTYGDMGIAVAQRVAPGSKERSVLWARLQRLDDFRMPLLASNVVDPQAVDIVGRWIDQVLAGTYPPGAPSNLRAIP